MPRPPDPRPDPRPLTGEPLSIDLLNTRWIDAEGPHDLLDLPDGLTIWLAGDPQRIAFAGSAVTADARTRDQLLQARAALDTLAASPRPPFEEAARGPLSAVLAHGRVRHLLGEEGPRSVVEVDHPSWLPAWSAAENYLHLLGERPDRIRPCANPQCVLHFYDVSKNGTRRWCSMSGCGNRAKASRHYARHGQN
ncbi:CGNR zinc finger domain-containing protein [Streptomyces sp. NPDC051561]|uniref:CGNR zinc finger domain-containing protein n=1 Tax=Streptomyces sp. NPDC051561 TaxID=3365658 RepID=UPI0037AABEF0